MAPRDRQVGFELPGKVEPIGKPAADGPPPSIFPDQLATVKEVRRFEETGEVPDRCSPFASKFQVRRKSRLFRKGITGHLTLQNYKAPEILEYFKLYHPEVEVTLAAIQADMRAMRANWRETWLKNSLEVQQQEIAKLDALEQSVVELYESGEVADFAKSMVMIAKRRAALLGLDKAQKIDFTGRIVGSQLTDAELESIIKSNELANTPALEGEGALVDSDDGNEEPDEEA